MAGRRRKPPEWGGAREGSGRPPGPDGVGVRVSIRIGEELLERFAKKAKREGLSLARAHVRAMKEWLGESDEGGGR